MTPEVLDRVLERALTALLDDLRACAWYVREHEVVNLFVFGHLVPLFQESSLDLTLIGIEMPVLQVEKGPRSKLSAKKDLVLWRDPRSTRWKGCQISRPVNYTYHREHGCKPLAVVEWKNISRITARPTDVQAEYEADAEWLRKNLAARMFEVGYAILVDQRSSDVRLTCRKLTSKTELEFLRLPPAAGTRF